MQTLMQEFTIHPVGQGLFYTGVIDIENYYSSKFTFTYDCGSINKDHCSKEVERFRENLLEKNILDLLVISHFDAAHVSHIGELLKGGIKIKKLVMPFLSFAQRLLLVLKIVADGNAGGEDGFTLALIIDPLGTLGPNLDDGSEIFVIEKGPEGPPQNPEDSSQIESKEEDEYVFDYEVGAKENLAQEETSESQLYPGSIRLSKVKDNRIGFVVGATLIKIMEFIFYRRSVGKEEKEYFERIADKFLDKFDIKKNGESGFLTKVIEAVKAQKNGRLIKEFFKAAKEGLDVGIKGRPLDNLNTTALCMLHQNLPAIWTLGSRNGSDKDGTPHAHFNVSVIQKPSADEYYLLRNGHYYHPMYHYSIHNDDFVNPNVLFTSDGYLMSADEVDLFYSRYSNRWTKFWLFQIPHHGSKKNSGTNLLSRVLQNQKVFINYGTDHQWKTKYLHPDKEVIDIITATGHANGLIPVNEFVGLGFNLRFHIY